MTVLVGVNLPQFGHEATPALLRTFASAAEDAGLATLWVIERTLRPVASADLPLGIGAELPTIYSSVLSPIETLTFAAAVTSRIRLGTSVIDALFHSPAVLARRLATLDRLSEGRCTAGLGQGYLPQEFTTTNVPVSRRGRGFEEFIAALQAAWGDDPVEFAGDFYTVPRSDIGPKPTQLGGIPILVGAASMPAVQRAGRLGLGLNPISISWDQLTSDIAEFRSAAAQAGYDQSALPIVVRGMLQRPGSSFAIDDAPLSGANRALSDDVARLAEMGVTEVSFDMGSAGYTPSEQLAQLDKLADL